MNIVVMDPGSYKLKPVEAVARLIGAPGFLRNPNSEFAEYIVDKVIRSSAANTSVVTDVTLLMSQAHMGVTLFRQQRETSRLLGGFVYKMLIPDDKVPTGTKFFRKYRITDQREAQHGTYDTITNGVQTTVHSEEFRPTSKVVTMQFGSLLSVTVPSVAVDLITRELEMASTAWELTRTCEVLQYCAAQPTLIDRIARQTKTAGRAERLDYVLTMAELTCGMVNIQPDTFVCALENARRVLESESPEVLIMGESLFRIVSQQHSGSSRSHIVTEDTVLSPEFAVYTMDNETVNASDGHQFVMKEVAHHSSLGTGLPFVEGSLSQESTKVNYIMAGGGPTDKIPIVRVDGVQMEHGVSRNTSTEHKAFSNSEGFKWEYFTVGCTAPAVAQLNPYTLLDTKDADELNFKHVAQRSPSSTFLHRYDGAVVEVTLRSLHARGNPKELFTAERRRFLQTEVDSLMTGGERTRITRATMIALAKTRDWYAKTNNPASLLEFDTRHMVIPQDDRWLVRPRFALFNSSGMNSIENEIAQIGSELLARFGKTTQAQSVTSGLEFIDHALLHSPGIQAMLAVRNEAFANTFTLTALMSEAEWPTSRKYWSLLTDPVCTIALHRRLLAKEGSSEFTSQERTILVQLEDLINGVLFLFHAIVGERTNSVLPYMVAFNNLSNGDEEDNHGYPTSFTANEIDYCNIMYWVVLPAMGARVYRTTESRDRDRDVRHVPVVRDGDLVRLENELNLTNSEMPTVPQITGVCFFSKTTPGAGYEDATDVFVPTAGFSESSDASFHPTSIVTYMWAVRIHKLTGVTNYLAKFLLGVHYSTLLTRRVIQDHYDTKYYSGLSYLMFRGLRFTGCGISLMPQKSMLYTLGTGVICKPTSHNTHQLLSVNQYCESTIIPDTMDSPGLYISNMYMKDLRGGDVHIDTQGPYDVVVADAFNGFCPESDTSCGGRRPYIFTTGRSERLTSSLTRDPRMRTEGYSCIPTLLHPFTSVHAVKPKSHSRSRGSEESNLRLFCKTQHVVDLDKGVLDAVHDPFKDTVDRASGNKRITDIMHKELGVAFCGTYGVGLTSDKKLKFVSDETTSNLVDRLAPRISGTGLFANTPVHSAYRLITPIFNRIFESTRYSRMLQC